jgi:hypothetical protein
MLAAAASALVAAAAPVAAAEEQKLDLVSFFTGRTHGEGDLRIALKKPVRHIVDSAGRRGANGEFLLVDRIKEGDDAVRERRWAMRPSGANGFTGTMTDAVGPVHVTLSGSKATIRYKMKGGIRIDQQLALQSDGKTLSNHVTGRRLGVRVARLQGTIRKLD